MPSPKTIIISITMENCVIDVMIVYSGVVWIGGEGGGGDQIIVYIYIKHTPRQREKDGTGSSGIFMVTPSRFD